MARICDLCGRGANTANLVSHAQNKVKSRQKSNLQSLIMKGSDGNIEKKKKVCASCRRTQLKQN